jgi:hypothetical protein
MDQAFWDFLNQFLLGALGILAPIVLGFVAAWLKSKRDAVRAGMTTDELYLLDSLSTVAVQAAEQAKLAGLIKEKKNYAVDIMVNYLTSRGVKIDLKAIDALIEAAVLREFGKSQNKSIGFVTE